MADVTKHALHQKTFINVPPEKVFDTITSPEGWDAFFLNGFEIDPRPGGKLFFRWKNWGPDSYTNESPGEVVTFERPNKFVFKWGSKMVSTVEFDLAGKYGGTVVNCREYGYPDSEDGLSSLLDCACGWGEAVTLLKFYLEHGIVYTQPDKSIE